MILQMRIVLDKMWKMFFQEENQMEELLKIFAVILMVLAVLYRMRVRYLPKYSSHTEQPACGVGDCPRCGLCRGNNDETYR